MKRTLLFFILLFSVSTSFSQEPTIDAGADTVVCPPDCIDLTAVSVGGDNTTDYIASMIAYSPDPYEGTARSLSDDGTSGAISIGFDFCFYGDTYSNCYVGANGWLGFTGPFFSYTPVAIPSAAASTPKNCIMGPWQDLNPSIGGTVKTQLLGVAPFRRFVVTWETVPFFSCTDLFNTQQIIIYESTNIVENHIDNKFVCPSWVGGRAVQGVHNADGTEAVSIPGRNNTVWTADSDAVRYTPLGDSEIEWYVGPLLIGSGPDLTVCPGSPTTYIAKLLACGSVVAEDEVFVDVICCEPPTMTQTELACFGSCDATGTAEGIGVPPFSYQWDVAAGSQTTATAVGLCAGTYTVDVTDALGCVETGEITIDDPEEVTGSITSITLVTCFGLADGTVTVEGLGGTGVLTYDIGDGPMPTGIFTGLAPGDYIVTITDENGCSADVLLSILTPDLLEANLIETIDVLCNGDATGELTIEGVGGAIPYEYSLEGGAFVPSGNFTGLAAGTYNLEVRDVNGCLATIVVDINEPTPLTIAGVAAINITCFEGADGSIEVIGAGGVSPYLYAIDGGAFGDATTFTELSIGTYTISVKDDNDCEAEIDFVLTEAPAVAIDEIIINETCLGDCLGEINLDPIVGIAPFTFSIDACASSDLLGNYTGLCAGSYDVCVVDDNGCTYTNTVIVIEGVVPADATMAAVGPLCVNDSPVVLTAVSPGGVYTGAGVVAGTFNPSIAGVGTHTITNTIAIGCGDIATLDIVVNALPVVSFAGAGLSGCEPLAVPFSNTGDTGDCTWDFGDGGISSFCGDVLHTYENSGLYDVSLTVVDANGCSNSSTFYDYVDVFPVPNAVFRFGPQPTTTINTEINFTDMSTGADTWDWTFDELGNSNEQNPTFLFPEVPNEYVVSLVVENSFGCIDNTSQTIIISEQYLIYVPNTITPDGDLYNEVFKPYFNGIDIYNYTLRIYNRWGEVMFESNNPDYGWNGTYGDKIVEDGVYVWHIVTNEITSDKKLEYHGHVTVLK